MAEKPKPKGGEEALRARYRGLMAVDRGGHPSETDWERLACGEMEAEERGRALEHVTSCASCAEAYRALTMLGEEAPAFDPGAPRPHKERPGRWESVPPWSRWAAAGLAAATLLSWGVLQDRRTVPSVTRAPAPRTGLVLIEPVGTVSQVPAQFRWNKVDAAEAYRVRLFQEDGLLLWTSEPMKEGRADWPAGVTLAPGRYFWDVEAFREGNSLARSELQAFVRTP
jgi:hypothetical protein